MNEQKDAGIITLSDSGKAHGAVVTPDGRFGYPAPKGHEVAAEQQMLPPLIKKKLSDHVPQAFEIPGPNGGPSLKVVNWNLCAIGSIGAVSGYHEHLQLEKVAAKQPADAEYPYDFDQSEPYKECLSDLVKAILQLDADVFCFQESPIPELQCAETLFYSPLSATHEIFRSEGGLTTLVRKQAGVSAEQQPNSVFSSVFSVGALTTDINFHGVSYRIKNVWGTPVTPRQEVETQIKKELKTDNPNQTVVVVGDINTTIRDPKFGVRTTTIIPPDFTLPWLEQHKLYGLQYQDAAPVCRQNGQDPEERRLAYDGTCGAFMQRLGEEARGVPGVAINPQTGQPFENQSTSFSGQPPSHRYSECVTIGHHPELKIMRALKKGHANAWLVYDFQKGEEYYCFHGKTCPCFSPSEIVPIKYSHDDQNPVYGIHASVFREKVQERERFYMSIRHLYENEITKMLAKFVFFMSVGVSALFAFFYTIFAATGKVFSPILNFTPLGGSFLGGTMLCMVAGVVLTATLIRIISKPRTNAGESWLVVGFAALALLLLFVALYTNPTQPGGWFDGLINAIGLDLGQHGKLYALGSFICGSVLSAIVTILRIQVETKSWTTHEPLMDRSTFDSAAIQATLNPPSKLPTPSPLKRLGGPDSDFQAAEEGGSQQPPQAGNDTVSDGHSMMSHDNHSFNIHKT